MTDVNQQESGDRFTRYCNEHNLPQDHKKILKRLDRRGDRPFGSRNEFRGFLTKANKVYERVAVADEATRFYLNEGIISELSGKVHICTKTLHKVMANANVRIRKVRNIDPEGLIDVSKLAVERQPTNTPTPQRKEVTMTRHSDSYIHPNLLLFLLAKEKSALDLIRCCEQSDGSVVELSPDIQGDADVLSICRRLVNAKVFTQVSHSTFQVRVPIKNWNLLPADEVEGQRRVVAIAKTNFDLLHSVQNYVLYNPVHLTHQMACLIGSLKASGSGMKATTARNKLCYYLPTQSCYNRPGGNPVASGHFGIMLFLEGQNTICVPGFEVRKFIVSDDMNFYPNKNPGDNNQEAELSTTTPPQPEEPAVESAVEPAKEAKQDPADLSLPTLAEVRAAFRAATPEELNNFEGLIAMWQSAIADERSERKNQMREQLKRELEQEEARAAAAAAEKRAAEERAKALAAELAELE